MNFATWSIRNPAPAILLFILLTLAGLYSFQHLPVANLPDMELPTIMVNLSQPGAAPAQLETEVARKVEDSLATLSGIKHLTTLITEGQVQIRADFVLNKAVSEALIETKDAVDRIRSDLPSDLQQPTISIERSGSNPVLVYAVSSPRMDEEALSWFVDDTVSKAIMAVPGIGSFERTGGVQRQVRVEVDPVRLTALGATAADVSRALSAVQQQASGGRAQLGDGEQAVRTTAMVAQAEALRDLPVMTGDGHHFRLDQVGTVRDTHAERTQIALLDGKPVVTFSIYRAAGFDEVSVAAGVEAVLKHLRASDDSLAFTKVSGTIDNTRQQFDGSMHMLYEGALLAVLVVWWFLRDWRATLISAAALPLSILPTFAVIHFLGYSLNTLTLLALAVIVGILVDDAIVEIENIERHRRAGKPSMQAVVDAVTEIALPVIATTLTLVVVFLPTAFMGGIAGRFFQQFGWTAVVAVLSSLLVARLLTPMMAAHLLRGHSPNHCGGQVKPDSRLMGTYLRCAEWCLAHRRVTLLASIAIFAGSIALVPLMSTGLAPPPNGGFSKVSMELQPGSSLDDTVAVAERARLALRQVSGIEHVMTSAGGNSKQLAAVRRATLTLVLAPRGDRPDQTAIENQVRKVLADVAGARFSLGSGSIGEKLSLILASDDSTTLKATAMALEHQLRGIPGLGNVTSTAELERPEIIVRPDVEQAAALGVTTSAIAETVRIATAGDYTSRLAKLDLDQRQLNILVRIPDADRQNLDAIGALRVAGSGGLVPLESVAHLSVGSGPSEIERYDRRRFASVTADLGGTPLGTMLETAKALPAVTSMPAGVELIETGDAEIMAERGCAEFCVTGISVTAVAACPRS